MIIQKIKYGLLVIGLLRAAKADLQSRKIPNQCIKELLVSRGMILIIEGMVLENQLYVQNILRLLKGFLYGGGMMLLCYIFTKKGIGAGDVKLISVIGTYMGSVSVLRVMALTFWLAFVFCLVKGCLRKEEFKKQVALGPFIFIAVIIEMICF